MAFGIWAGTRDTDAGRAEPRRRSAILGAWARIPVMVGILVGLPLSLGLWLLLYLGARALFVAA